MAFEISKEQQKLFIEHFMKQVLDHALQLVDQGQDRGSPGETIQAVGAALIRHLYEMDTVGEGEAP